LARLNWTVQFNCQVPLRMLAPSQRFRCVVALALLALAGCDRKASGAPGGPPPGAPAEVGVVTIAPRDVILTTELPGRTSPFRVAEVRARVNAIVLERLFTEGSDVTAGQKLFRLDAAPYEADLARASASLARAKATAANARLQADRATQMSREGVGSKQEQENASAALQAAEADVAAAHAALRAAGIAIGFTTVTAPVAGHIGRAEVTEGAFVQQSSATLMATIQQLDPMYVDLVWSSTEAMRLRHDVESGKLKSTDGKAKVEVVLEDGRVLAEKGELQFTDVTVDPSTGSVSLRALVPNPRRELLPGMFVRARFEEGTRPQAILVPQRAVTRDAGGRASALVVKDGKVERRTLKTEREVGDAWLVTEGLAPGEQVVLEGLQKVRPGGSVTTVPAAASARPVR
jgi:membrane fusion protein (multidrug efflux system)